jgi:hypothetical protein
MGEALFEDLHGYLDIHVHSAPSVFARSVTDKQLAQITLDLKMRGFVLKAHEESTVSRAEIIRSDYPELEVFGALVLNWYVGGLNPFAVNLALEQGAKIIWMPTNSAEQHIVHYGGPAYTSQPSQVRLLSQPGIRITDETLKPKPELIEILDLIAEKNAIAASGHLSPQETEIFVQVAKERSVQKILIAHPDLAVNRMPLEQQLSLSAKGAYVEKSYLPLMPGWGEVNVSEIISSIERIGPQRCVLQTDFGQANHVPPPLGYQRFLRILSENGVCENDLRQMGSHNPSDMLDLPRMSF